MLNKVTFIYLLKDFSSGLNLFINHLTSALFFHLERYYKSLREIHGRIQSRWNNRNILENISRKERGAIFV